MSEKIPWWRSSVVYQVYVRSFADANGDGTGDINGIRSRLPYLRSLGVDALWVNPWYVSPLNDGGYDVADYRDIDPRFGTLDDAKRLMAEAEQNGLRVIVDLVPNHTSSEHVWFQQALASGPNSPERARYHFVPGKGDHGELPPNNWTSVFGGPAWSRVPDGDWYLHMFDVTQPDLNWEHPEVRAEFEAILRFWLDLGAGGFRVDVAHALIKGEGYPDAETEAQEVLSTPSGDHPLWDQPDLQVIIEEWRRVLDEYPDKVMVAEAWVPSWERLANYVQPGKYHQTFDFHFTQSNWRADTLRKTIETSMGASGAVGSIPTWVLSNHDLIRHATRLALPVGTNLRDWLNRRVDLVADVELGERRARAAALLMLGLPGSVYLYQGEELGLPEVHDLPEAVLEDPTWARSGHADRGRDGCRVPIPWTREGNSYGFGDNGSWLPQPPQWGEFSVEANEEDPNSMLSLYRKAISIRSKRLRKDEVLDWIDMGNDVLAFRRGSDTLCVVNLGRDSLKLPEGEVLLSSVPVDDGFLPTDGAVWVSIES